MANNRLPDINTILIAGTVLGEPDVRQSEDGKLIGRFRIHSVRKFRDNTGQLRENRCEVDVIVQQKLAELCQRNLRAGSPVLLDGELLSHDNPEEGGRGTLEIRARRIQFLEQVLKPRGTEGLDTEEARGEAPDSADLEEQESTEFDFGYRELEL
ncbi:MAG: single-stranded DNA-binding protein [candidate division KSB1 bacterium]|nr:single-stranded DNA-binding protein [candidate division KSB1 bacterium]